MTSLETNCRRRAALLRALTATALVVALASHQGGTWLHVVTGCLFAASATGHVLANARWIRTVARRLRHGVPRRVATDVALDVLMALLAAALTATGVAALMPAAGAVHERAADVHGALAPALLLVVAVHVARHWRRHRRGHRRRRAARRRDAVTGGAATGVHLACGS